MPALVASQSVGTRPIRAGASPLAATPRRPCTRVAAFKSPLDPLLDRVEDPILRTALKEPLAFWGGMFAGTLKLNLTEEPLRGWVDRTAAVANDLDTLDTTSTALSTQDDE